jgi:predicted MFS family arabinose efflux permease
MLLFFFLPKKHEKGVKHEKLVVSKQSSAYKDTLFLFFILMVTLFATSFFQLFASIPQYFNKACHYDEDTIGMLMGLNGILVVLIEMPLVTVLEKKQNNIFRYIVIGSLCLPTAFFMLHYGNGVLLWSILYIIIITFSEIFCMPFMMNYSLSKPIKERQGQYSALYSISFGIANIVAPIVGLGIADAFGFEAMFNFFILLGVLTVCGFVYLKKKTSDPYEILKMNRL